MKYFILPDEKIYSEIDSDYLENWVKGMSTNFNSNSEATKVDKKSYACFNYYGSLSSKIKLAHFEKALGFSTSYFGKSARALDLGCADGIFLPSLSKYFKEVIGIDYSPAFIDNSNDIIKKLNLKNITLFCNQDQSLPEISKKIQAPVDIIYSLEVLEHVGHKESMYQDKLQFLVEASQMLKNDGIFVVSVPRMIGWSFFVQRFGLRLLRVTTEPISWKNFIKAVVFNNTDNLEKDWWPGGHMGFNHNKLEAKIKLNFEIIKKKKMLFQVFYVFKKKQF